MLKRLVVLLGAVAALAVSGCSCNGCTTCSSRGPILLHCQCPCYDQAIRRDTRQIMDVIDVHFLTYDRHDPYQCDPCLGD